MSKTHLVIPDPHASPDHNNDRATWIGKLMYDIRPNVVINLGDTADMASLCTYDKGTKGFEGRRYRADIDAHNDFQEKLWAPMEAAKYKKPRKVTIIGNHEQRIERATNYQPELEGTIGYGDLDLDKHYDEVVHYEGGTPGTITIDDITYAHYLPAGVMGRPISGVHQASNMLTKKFVSCTVGHSHTVDFSMKTTATGKKILGLVAGCGIDYMMAWAGQGVNDMWWSGVMLKKNVEDGVYDLEMISMDRLRREYG